LKPSLKLGLSGKIKSPNVVGHAAVSMPTVKAWFHVKIKLETWANAQRDGRLPNIGGALCSTPQSLADVDTGVPCSNAAKTRNPLKFAGVPQTK